jgi:hypothetical protein
MKGPDLDRERCEKKLTLKEFTLTYNEGLPEGFPAATDSLLEEFSASNTQLFKNTDQWSLDQHRKRVMDWLPSRLRTTERKGV